MSQSKKDIESTSNRVRLPVQTSTAPKKVLDEMLSEVLKNPARLMELPFEIPGSAEPLRLTVEMELGGERPIWNFYAGEGANTRTLWTYALRDTDMISEVLSLSVSSPAPASSQPAAAASTGWPDSIRSQAAPPPVKESPPAGQPAAAYSQAKPVEQVSASIAEPKPFLETNQPNIMLGHILVDSGLIPEPVLDAALSLQEMVRQGGLTPDEATDALRKLHSKGVDLQDVVAEVRRKRHEKPPADAVDLLRKSGLVSEQDIIKAKLVVEQLRKAGLDSAQGGDIAKVLLDLLRLAGFVSDDDIRRASTAGSNRPPDICKALLSSGTIDALSFEVASRFVKHVRHGTFKQEQAVIALHYSQRMRTGFEETVHSMGWKVPIES